MNIGHCPETSKDANGYNRYYRIKVLLNVAEEGLNSTLCSAKAQRVGKVLLVPAIERLGRPSTFLRWLGLFCYLKTNEEVV